MTPASRMTRIAFTLAATCIVIGAICGFIAGRASAVTITGAPADMPFQEWADASQIPTVPGTVAMDFSATDVVYAEPGVIHWWSNDASGVADSNVNRGEFLHELGHEFEWVYLYGRKRAHLRYLIARTVRPGYTKEYRRTRRVPQLDWGAYFDEQWAMAYSYCALGIPGPTADWYGFSYTPAPAQQARACALARRAAR